MLGCVVQLGVALALFIKTTSASGNIFVILAMGTICVDTVFNLAFGMRSLAEVHKKSTSALQLNARIMATIPTQKRKPFQQFIRSCWTIKLKFGDNNFVEMMTPLNCLAHVIQISVQILLLT